MNNVYFSPPEEEIIDSLQEIYGITHMEACEQVIMQKRELAFQHGCRGNFELEKTLLLDLGEWTDIREENFKKTLDIPKENVIILSS